MASVVPPNRQPLMARTDDERELESQLRRYPPLLEWVSRFINDPDGYEEHGLRTASDLLGARAYHALTALVGDHDRDWLRDAETRIAVAQSVLEAVPVLWPVDMLDTARSLELPPHTISPDILPYPLMWWCLSKARGQQAEIESFLIGQTETGASVLVYSAPDERGRFNVTGPIDITFQSRWPDDYAEDGNAEIILQMLAFMNSRYVDDAVEQLSRPERRRVEREGADLFDGAAHVHVIRLRSPEPLTTDGTPSGEGGRWSHRWFVRGHYRAQWLPSKQAHRVTWIAPYIKGPSDKPVQLPGVVVKR